jgi:hypothetical protein
MDCPDGLAPVVLDLIRWGIYKARIAGWSGDAARAAVEADHIHNLPDLISDYEDHRLRYYWEYERAAYLAKVGREEAGSWSSFWDELRPFVDRIGGASL